MFLWMASVPVCRVLPLIAGELREEKLKNEATNDAECATVAPAIASFFRPDGWLERNAALKDFSSLVSPQEIARIDEAEEAARVVNIVGFRLLELLQAVSDGEKFWNEASRVSFTSSKHLKSSYWL